MRDSMKNIRLIWIAVLLISACSTAEATAPESTSAPLEEKPLATVTPVCISSVPTEGDIERALSFVEDVFAADAWERSHVVSDGRVSVAWQNIPQDAVVYLEALIFPCSYEEPDLDRYFNDQTWDAIFSNYESYELIDECETGDGLRLYQFEAAGQEFDYDVQYWVMNDTDTRVMALMLIFPFGSESILDDYSSRLFPELANCS
jgi:hypothetical protein